MVDGNMPSPRLLDLFCGAGGAGVGYARAGFTIVGCDIDSKPLRHNPYECYQGDAMECLDTLLTGSSWHGYTLDDFAVIHASPPCQEYSVGRHISIAKKVHPTYPRLITPMRARMRYFSGLWVIENVQGAASELNNPLMLCGTSLGCRVWRHRLFESNAWLFAAGPCQHRVGDVSVRRGKAVYIGICSEVSYVSADGSLRWRPKRCPAADAKLAMGIDWMNSDELGEAIPPAYTEWIGRQLHAALYPSWEDHNGE